MRKNKTRGRVCVYQNKGRSTWRVQVTRPDGSRTSNTFATRELAEEVARHTREQYEDECTTVAEAIDMFIAELVERGTSPGYHYAERHKLESIFPDHGTQLLEELHPVVAQRLYDELRAKGFATDTHRNTLNSARSMCKWLVKHGHMSSNPFEGIEGKGRRKRGKKQLTRDEAKVLMDYCLEDPHVHTTAVLCCLVLGMRAGEIIKLTPRSLDMGGTIVRIERSTTKSDAGERLLEIPSCLKDRMPALCSATLNNTQLYRRSLMMCRRAGVEQVGPHALRGTHASLARAVGATSQLVSSALGHASTSVTEAHYTSQSATRQAEATVALKVLSGGKR